MNAKEFLMRGINLERRVDTIKDQIEHYNLNFSVGGRIL